MDFENYICIESSKDAMFNQRWWAPSLIDRSIHLIFFFEYIFNYIFLGFSCIFSIKWSMENQGKGAQIIIDYVIIHKILNIKIKGQNFGSSFMPEFDVEISKFEMCPVSAIFQNMSYFGS